MRRRNKHDIVIELTSLLDVIMIIIFMVMAQNSRIIGNKQEALDEAAALSEELAEENEELADELAAAKGKLKEGGVEELLDRLNKAENRLEGYAYMDDVIKVVNVTLENKYDNTVRSLTYGEASDASQNTVSVQKGGDFSAAANRFRVYLNDYVKLAVEDTANSTIVYIIFTYDPKKVYQDDYAAIEKALKDAERRTDNSSVRYRVNRLQ